ncbi:MAG: hypothetical protein K0Q55_3668 [Verrucomicrobia bacterium]|jgi:hypothetical protein|nr:hypothetical protein [Verrucomicrobiota bacterium]
MSAANVIELRRLLAEKFPGLRTRADAAEVRTSRQMGLPQIDEAGGLPEGALTEVVAGGASCGSALMMRLLLSHAAQAKQITALVDGHDSFDVTGMEANMLARLLWVRCKSAEEALQAVDLILRDGNLSLVLLDLVSNPAIEVRKIPATTWYRFQRLVAEKKTVCLIFTPRLMVMPAQIRITLTASFSLTAIEQREDELIGRLTVEILDNKQQRGIGRRKIA